jgi:hypothetical protein
VQHTPAGAATHLAITFTDGNTLRVNCIHRFQQKGLCYFSIDDLRSSRVTNGKRYVASLFFDFSFYLINQTLNNTLIHSNVMHQFEQRLAKNTSNPSGSLQNFWLNNSAQHHTLINNVKKYIHALPMNTLTSRVAYKLNDLQELIKELLRFPKVVLPPRENNLTPIPATTSTRRLHP